MLPDLWVLTVAPNSRAHEVDALRDSLGVPFDRFVVVTTQPDPIPGALLFDSDELNIAKWWTVGLEHIDGWYAERHGRKVPRDVFIVESDTRITPDDLDRVRAEMRATGCVMGGADWQHLLPDGVSLVRRSNSPLRGPWRLPGIGLVVAGEVGLRHDPQFRWWYVDDDLEWQARERGGTVLVGGTTLTHTGGSPMVGDRRRFADEDVVKFNNKWGGTPADGGRVSG